MSGGYADRLKHYPHKGVCGLPEQLDTERQLASKLELLVKRVWAAKHLVVFTGAGISTAAGIPDFRGPSGIWTVEQAREKEQKKEARRRKRRRQIGAEEEEPLPPPEQPKAEDDAAPKSEAAAGPSDAAAAPLAMSNDAQVDFATAQPTYTHTALVELAKRGHLKYLITQNVDGLDQRAGFPRDRMAVLHGCIFEEKCDKCGKITLRDRPVDTISFQPTGSVCKDCGPGKGAVVRDTLLDWEDPLPEDELFAAQEHCEQSDLVLALGTSLRIEPAGGMPKTAGSFILVNLQQTPYDNDAALIVRAPVDLVLQAIMSEAPPMPEV